ncbi:MAG: PAS domain-containing sensor histidine kinase [Bacteroidota bacterium]|nr:PAS domain-containing sensor histidine kinase [Bacteroidota bacterium]
MLSSEESTSLISDNDTEAIKALKNDFFFKEVVLDTPTALYFCDEKGRILFFNNAAARLWGREPVIGTDYWCGSWKIYNTNGSALSRDKCPMAISLHEKRSIKNQEIIIERPDGVRKHILPHTNPVYNESGELRGAYNLLIDITAQKEAQKALDESEKKFREMADFIPEIIWTANQNGTVDYYNNKWYSVTGAKPDFGDQSWIPLLHPEDVKSCHENWYESIKTGQPYLSEFRLKNQEKNGEYCWFLGRASTVRDADNNIIKWCGSCTDIQEQKKNIELKDEFVSIASHELKTPLTSLKAYLQLIEIGVKDTQEGVLTLYANKATKYVNRLENLIDELLNVSKIQAGNMSLNISEFYFEYLVFNHLEEIKYFYSSHKFTVLGECKIQIKADKEKIEQVISNYISNAIKYSPNSNEIIINIFENEHSVIFSVKDFGIGIQNNEINKVFERFSRLKTDKYYTGLGLGLYIASEIIQKHGGKTWVESEFNNGSVFYFCLPKNLNSDHSI